LTLATTAQAQWRDERHGPVFRDKRARIEHRAFVRHEDWRFDRGRGWRLEHRPGFWSPYYVWWWTGGRVVMLAAPTVTVVNYPTGQYQTVRQHLRAQPPETSADLTRFARRR
jgi:hypothetical protein